MSTAGVMRELSATRYPLTDSGNAEMIAALYGESIRYDRRRQRWLVWDGVIWRPEADALTISGLAKKAARQRLRESADVENPDERAKVARWAIASESRQKIDAAVALVRGEPPVMDSGEGWDSDPWLLGTPNGVVDLSSGILRQATKDDRLTMRTGIRYNPEAKSPRFGIFLDEIFGGDKELVHYVNLWLGYSITGNTSEQKVFMGYGRGSNGKGTLLRILFYVLGDYSQAIPSSTFKIQHSGGIPNDLARMETKRLVANSENLKSMRIDEEKIKLLSGQDTISARFLNREFFDFVPELKLWLFANNKPIVTDDSFGFWRRMKIIPFTKTFKLNPGLDEELKREAEGIFAHLVRCCLMWQKERLINEPLCVQEATEIYRQESDWFFDFKSECLTEGDNESVRASELYNRYKEWMLRQGYSEKDRECLKPTLFGKKLSEKYEKVHTMSGKMYIGVGLYDGFNTPPSHDMTGLKKKTGNFSIYTSPREDCKNGSQPVIQPQKAVTTRHTDIENYDIPE